MSGNNISGYGGFGKFFVLGNVPGRKMQSNNYQRYYLTPNARQKLSTKRTKVRKEHVGKGMLLNNNNNLRIFQQDNLSILIDIVIIKVMLA